MVPSYKKYTPISAVASRTHAAIKRTKTRPERLLLTALRKLGIRYNHPKRRLPGNPDIVFCRSKTVVFCDGDFWHGRNWLQRRAKLMVGSNADYWVQKIEYNRSRDRQNSRLLMADGWVVIRLWETEIIKNPKACAEVIVRARKGCFSAN